MHSPYRRFYRKAPFARLLPFLKPGFHHVRRTLKAGPKAEACFYLDSGNHHSADCCKILLLSGRKSYSRDVTWKHPRKTFDGYCLRRRRALPRRRLRRRSAFRRHHRCPRVHRSLWEAPAYGLNRRRRPNYCRRNHRHHRRCRRRRYRRRRHHRRRCRRLRHRRCHRHRHRRRRRRRHRRISHRSRSFRSVLPAAR